MKKSLFLIFIIVVLLLSACQVTIRTGAEDSPSVAPTEKPTDKPTATPEATVETVAPTPTEEPSPSPTEEQENLIGELNGNTYVNKALGFTATIPEGWVVANEEEMSTLFGYTSDYMEEVTGLKADSQMYIFYCSKNGIYESGLNANINISLSNQQAMMSLLTSEDGLNFFLEQYRPMIEQLYQSDDVEVSGDMGVKVGDNEYVKIHISGDLNGTNITQDQYFIGVKGYAIVITLTYYNKTEKNLCNSFLESMKYDQ